MNEEIFIPKSYKKIIESGKVSWESPSNIALVKYWGKRKIQIPENPSISFTLNNCKTITSVSYQRKDANNKFDFEVYLDGNKQDDFKPKIETFFGRVEAYLPFLKQYKFTIETENTFPHSSGIASSASGMSALSLCLMSIEEKMVEIEYSKAEFNRKASFLSRLGSGSACRSIEGELVVWGEHQKIKGSSNLFGTKYPNTVHERFRGYKDTILLVDKGQKQVSSTVGHNLMHDHPFSEQRFNQAIKNLSSLQNILESGELDRFISLVESEALTLHAMMMTSSPYYILMKPNTLKIINKIWDYRRHTNSSVCFTLDAGANVHVLYPLAEADKTLQFIKDELIAYCENGQYIEDQIGMGANRII